VSEGSAGIEDYFRRRYAREALYLPSGRLALYLAFREWLRPGDRILISPVNDDVVFFTVLAAGLVPVIAPLDPRTGNLDPDRVDEKTWSRIQAVMTTNLYGIPDRMERLDELRLRHRFFLIEDACQALDTSLNGRRIGEFSTVAAFSLTKHVHGVGGVLTYAERERGDSLRSRARRELISRSSLGKLVAGARHRLRSAAEDTRTGDALRRIRRRLLPPEPERPAHRMVCEEEEILRARESGAGLEPFDRWVRVDNAGYRMEPPPAAVRETLRQLQDYGENRRRRLEGTRRLIQLGLSPELPTASSSTALFRVPLFVHNREEVLRRFARLGLLLDYVYDPPLDLYVSSRIAERLPSPAEALPWSRDVLPVDPLLADRFLSLLDQLPPLVSALPATSIP